jgi:hypothetical protein
MLTATIRDDNGQALGIVVLSPKVFSSGKTGFFGVAKIEIGGQRYQAQAQAVAIAPKGDGDETAQAGE